MKKKKKRSQLLSALWCVTAGLAVTTMAGQAMAQSAPAANAAANQLDEVVVTARKRDESLLEIPVAVSAFSQDKIDALGANSLEALSAYTSGFAFQNVGQGGNGGRQNPNIRFRGLGVQQESGASRAGAVFWEGTYISDGAGILPLMDLARIEVIKGPQTAFFGRNTFAGAVNFIPAEPGEVFSGKASATYSATDDASYNFTGAVGGPLSERVGLRIAGQIDRVGADWFYDNGDPAGEENTKAVTATLVVRPTDSLKLKANGFYVRSDDTRSLQSQSATTAPGRCNLTYSGNFRQVGTGAVVGSFSTNLANSPRAFFCGVIPDWDTQPPNLSPVGQIDASTPRFPLGNTLAFMQTPPPEFTKSTVSAPDGLGVEYDLWRLSLSGDYQLAGGGTLSAIAARGETSNWSISDNQFGTPSPTLGPNVWLTGFVNWTRDSYAEVRYTSATDGRLRYSLGASYYKQDTRQADFPAFAGTRNNLNFEEGENYGVFGSVDYDLTDQLTLSLEGRWNDDTQTLLLSGPTGLPASQTRDVPQHYDAFMPRVILSYQPTNDMNLYASYARSYLQGISTNAANYAAAIPAAGINPSNIGFFTPRQTLTAYEVGFKQQISERLNYSIAVYTMDWENQTFFDLSPTFVAVNLPGDSRIKGVDFEAQVAPANWFQLGTALTYSDVEFTDFGGTGSIAGAVLAPGLAPGVGIDSKGKRPRYIPEWTGSVSGNVELGKLIGYEPGAFVRLDAIYQGSFFIDNFEFQKVEGYWKLNARAGVNVNDMFAVELYGNNLTNDLSWSTAGGDTSIVGSLDRKTFGPLPRKREYGLRFTAKF